jgi:hypothetical protein
VYVMLVLDGDLNGYVIVLDLDGDRYFVILMNKYSSTNLLLYVFLFKFNLFCSVFQFFIDNKNILHISNILY